AEGPMCNFFRSRSYALKGGAPPQSCLGRLVRRGKGAPLSLGVSTLHAPGSEFAVCQDTTDRAEARSGKGGGMSHRLRKCAAALFAASLTGVTAAVPAGAANQQQNGLVNVSVGDVSILDHAHIAVAASVAASICGVQVGPVAILANQVD